MDVYCTERMLDRAQVFLVRFLPSIFYLVLDATVVGFTSMSSQLTPLQVVTFLNDIFSRFDARLELYGLNKIKTIG